MEITKIQEEAVTREIDSHAENLTFAIERGECPRCKAAFRVRLNPRSIGFHCTGCPWFATYPIRTLGNSERAERGEALDLIALAERTVIEKAKVLAKAISARPYVSVFNQLKAEDALLAAVTLLESREALQTNATSTTGTNAVWGSFTNTGGTGE